MIRKTLTILSLVGLLLSAGLWGASYLNIGYYLARGEGAITLEKGSVCWSKGSSLLILYASKGDEGEEKDSEDDDDDEGRVDLR